jgi:hypothetical protein
MTMGQAAGTAAALAAPGRNVPGDLSATRLRAQLAEHGVLLEPLPTVEGRGAGPLAAEAG